MSKPVKNEMLNIPSAIKKANKLKLIQGVFKADKAKDILLTLIDSKVQFHQLNNFSSQIRHGNQDEFSLERIQDLKELKKNILKILDYADFNGQELQIDSSINIKIIEK